MITSYRYTVWRETALGLQDLQMQNIYPAHTDLNLIRPNGALAGLWVGSQWGIVWELLHYNISWVTQGFLEKYSRVGTAWTFACVKS